LYQKKPPPSLDEGGFGIMVTKKDPYFSVKVFQKKARPNVPLGTGGATTSDSYHGSPKNAVLPTPMFRDWTLTGLTSLFGMGSPAPLVRAGPP